MGLATLTLIALIRMKPNTLDIEDRTVPSDVRKNGFALLFLLVGFVAARSITKWLRFDAGLAQYWDFGQYLQATFNMAKDGIPLITFEGFDRSYFSLHRSLSVFVLGNLYRWFESPWVLWMWQGLGLTGFAVVVMGWIHSRWGTWRTPEVAWITLMGPSLFFLSPVFSGQFHWAYNFHILGLTLVGVGFWAELKGKWVLYVAAMTLAVLESETYGLILIPWSALQMMVCAKNRSALPRRTLAEISAQALVFAVSVLSLVLFVSSDDSINQVNHYFSNWGSNYRDMLVAWISNPGAVLRRLMRWEFVKWVLFFGAVSGVWANTRTALQRFLALVPMMVVLGLGHDNWLINIRHHYSLQLFVVTLAILFLHVLPSIAVPRKRVLTLGIVFFVSSLYIVPNPLKHTYEMADAHAKTIGKDVIDLIQADPELVVCCATQECGAFSERRYVLPEAHCQADHPLFRDAQREGRKVVRVDTKVHSDGIRHVLVDWL